VVNTVESQQGVTRAERVTGCGPEGVRQQQSARCQPRDGLRLLVERDQFSQIRLEELRKEIQQGIDSGEASPFDPEAILRKVSERMDQKTSHQE
jgi:C4-type Zn-finger protein